jgi:hypothetical protein
MQKQTTRQAQAACGVYTVMFTEKMRASQIEVAKHCRPMIHSTSITWLGFGEI